jgi:hypothetical protein
VVSAPALKDAQAIIDRALLADRQRQFAGHVSDLPISEGDDGETQPGVKDLPRFLTEFLGWQTELIHGLNSAQPLPESLTVSLPEFQEMLQPTYAVKNPSAKEGASPWLLLVQSQPATVDLDKPAASSERNWHASPAKKFERLLRETGVPIGLLTNGTRFRLIYSPPKENSGALTFPVGAMTEVSGRLILGGFHLLLSSWTLFNAPSDARLPALLQRSRDYQASVSEILAEQVLHALYELLRGFEAADKQIQGKLLRELAAKNSADIYGGLVTVLLRLVFTLFAEDRGLLPGSGLYVRHYAVHGLFERLRADEQRYPDTMDLRFGAWAQLLALFRVIYCGCKHPELKMPARAGHLFDPDRYPFLEGRASRTEPIGALPLVSDGVIYRILEKLCILDGERVSYRTLDVEEIGSVYQTIMGFSVEIASGTAIALKGKRKHGGVPAAPVITLEQLLAQPAKDRAKWLKENADTELTGEADKRLKAAANVDDLLVSIGKRMDTNATPAPVGIGGLVLQPTDERRRSGSHYTPRSFAEPIVRGTLEPILKRFGDQPKPEQILELKICDIAIGSGAFQVETCRQLADVLVRAWRAHGGRPQLPPDETEELLAMRTIAQRCLYGVDRNPMAVDLAKLSLWLATLAKDHPFTFLDHAIRCGDSLVGLTRRQIETFTWKTEFTTGQLWEQEVRKRTKEALRERQNLLGLGDDYGTPQLKREKLEKADELLDLVRFIGDAAVAAFFAGDKDKAREAKRAELSERIADYLGKGNLKQRPTEEVSELREGKFPILPFHWEIEFPEVFDREISGFDAIVGNPPFMGGKNIQGSLGQKYLAYLGDVFSNTGGQTDLVAYFFRKSYALLRETGTFGLVSTNTISQGDTRRSGLLQIRRQKGDIYTATRRVKWPGQAAVTVSLIHVLRSSLFPTHILDGRQVDKITAFLFHAGPDEDPRRLTANAEIAFTGGYPYGSGFLFDDKDEAATPIKEMNRILTADPSCAEFIRPYLGGAEMLEDPLSRPIRYVINFGEMSDQEARRWPELMKILEEKVRPERNQLADNVDGRRLKMFWWQWCRTRPALESAKRGKSRVLMHSFPSSHLAFVFVPAGIVVASPHPVFANESFALFGIVQNRVHEIWARFLHLPMRKGLDTPQATASKLSHSRLGSRRMRCWRRRGERITSSVPRSWRISGSASRRSIIFFTRPLTWRSPSWKPSTASAQPTAIGEPLSKFPLTARRCKLTPSLRRRSQESSACANCTPQWMPLSSLPTAGPTCSPNAPASSCLITRTTIPNLAQRNLPVAKRRNPGATDGPMKSATKSSPASSNSTPSARRRSGWLVKPSPSPPRNPKPRYQRLVKRNLLWALQHPTRPCGSCQRISACQQRNRCSTPRISSSPCCPKQAAVYRGRDCSTLSFSQQLQNCCNVLSQPKMRQEQMHGRCDGMRKCRTAYCCRA